MRLKANSTEQKLRGGYYTPERIADYIIRWAFSGDQLLKTVLEPSCGDGVFLESLISNTNPNAIECTAVELIETEAEKSRQKVSNIPTFEVINDDFYSVFENDLVHKKYDLVVGNPPYIRYQYLTPEQRETQARILVANGMKSNKLINSWVSFLVACVSVLNKNGKIGMVLPAELLQVAYAEDLRLFLVNNLSKITVITFEELVFPDVQQEIVLFLGEKNPDEEQGQINIVQLMNLECLENNGFDHEYKPVEHNSGKWTKYFLSNDEICLVNRIQEDSRFIRFSDISVVDVGITTGDNEYFSVSKNVVEKYGLQDIVLPLIGRSAHSKGLYFTYEDWQDNVNKGLRAHLIYFPDIPFEEYPEGYKEYIRYGEEIGINKGYKCSIRDRWYRIPSVWAPDAFFLRRNNSFPKFVLNSINAVSTDTMHRVRFKNDIDRDRALLSYYNSITFAFTEIEGRSYGGGVLEVLPGEVERIILPSLQELDELTLRSLITKIDKVIRKNKPIEPILDEVDQVILVNFLGIDASDVKKFRNIWKKLMKRRHTRKK